MIDENKFNWELVATTARAQIEDQTKTIDQLTDQVHAQRTENEQAKTAMAELKIRNRYLDEQVADLTQTLTVIRQAFK